MVDIFCLALLTLLAGGVGSRILRVLEFDLQSTASEAVFSTAAGFAVLAYATLALGLSGALYRWVFLCALTASAILLRNDVLRHVRNVKRLTGGLVHPGVFHKVLLGLLLVAAILNLVGALAPVTSADALAYHLAAPKIWLRHHAIDSIPWLWYTNAPMTVEMLFLLGMTVRSAILAVLLHWMFGILIILAIVGFCKDHVTDADPMLAAAIFYVSALVAWESTSGFVDLGLTLFAVLACSSFLHWMKNGSHRWLALGGAFAGLAAASKYTGGLVAVVLCVFVVVFSIRKKSLETVLRAGLVFGIPVLIMMTPWMLRDWHLTRDPLFPFLSLRAHPALQAEMALHARAYGFGKTWLDYFLVPFRITFKGAAFDRGEFVGPSYLALVPLCLALWRRPEVRFLLGFIALFTLAWFVGSQQIRFWLPVLPLAAVCCALEFGRLFERHRIVYFTGLIAVAFALAFGLGTTAVYNMQFLPVLDGRESRAHFLSEKSWFYPSIEWMNENLPSNARILFFPRMGYYLDREYLRPLDYDSLDWHQWVRDHDITHVLCIKSAAFDQCSVFLDPSLHARVLNEQHLDLKRRTVADEVPSFHVTGVVLEIPQHQVSNLIGAR